jgi:chromosome segregation ATPase
MDQTACCQPSVESIMRRLRGQGTPYTPPVIAHTPPPAAPPVYKDTTEVEELKQAVKALGAKLKGTYDELATKEASLQASAQTNQELADSLQQLQAVLNAKEQELSKIASGGRQTTTALQEAKAALAELQNKESVPLSELNALKEEIAALKSKEEGWQEEKRTLETFLERERQQRRSDGSNTNGQLVRLAMTCKQLEEETHSLQCERAATLRQFNQTKEQLEETLRTLSSEQQLKAAAETLVESGKRAIEELQHTIEAHVASIHTLTVEKDAAAQRESSYLSTISELNVAVAKGRASIEALNASLATAEESRTSLHLQLEQEKHTLKEAQESLTKALKEKEAADARVKEVEELLITKLQNITELEEQLGEALSSGEDFEHRALTAEENIKTLNEDLKKLTEARDELHEKSLKLEQQLGRSTTENTELKKRMETFERLKKSVAEASSHAHAILRTLGHGPKPQPSEEIVYKEPEPERSLFEEHFEQHELF